MLSGRPFLYFTLPGVAFILGVFWYHRKSKRIANGDGGGGKKSTDTEQQNIKTNDKYKQQNGLKNGNIATQNKPSRSMSINNGNIAHHKHGQPDIDDEISASIKQFGKSAPINIIPNGGCRISPVVVLQQQQQQSQQSQNNQVDSEVLKMKIQDAENKILRSIDEDFENLSSPVDLPDSIHSNRIAFYASTRNVNIKRDEPVVIKATTTPKISPENSFLESKYVKSAEQNNNYDDLPCATKTISATTRALSQSPPPPPPNNNDNSNNNNNVIKIDANILPVIQENKNEQPLPQSQQQQQQQHIEQIQEDEQNIQQPQLQQQETDITEVNTTESTTIVSDDKRKVDAASPSLSLCSEQSADSGKGSSLPRSEATRAKTTYEFLFPISLIGQLYGRKRAFITKIKAITGANITLLHETANEPRHNNVRICVVEGNESEINAALTMIRHRMPLKHYPKFSMQRIQYAQPQTVVPLSTESLLNLQLNLIEGINNDVVVSAVLSGAHLFVQQPFHPTHPSLALLQKGLYESYTNCETPMLPNIEISAVCVTCISGIWYRVQIVSADTEDECRCLVRFLDFGGYLNVYFNDLRQIRSDFMSLPFQATECILSNIEPIDCCWTPEAADILCKLTRGIVLQAQVAGYNSHNIPEIYLFACLGPNNVIFINKEIVARNLAKWVEMRD